MPKWPEHWREVQGRIEVIAGPMFAGKSSEIIRLVDNYRRARADVYVVKHSLDTRYEGISRISSHNDSSVDCEAIADPRQIYERVQELDPLVVVIDEVQFYIDSAGVLVEVVKQFAQEGRVVILAGLNTDFRGEPFGPMPILMAIADQVNNLSAICSECGAEATFTQRLINGEPASAESELVVVGAAEAYEARCRKHHKVPGKKGFADLFGQVLSK